MNAKSKVRLHQVTKRLPLYSSARAAGRKFDCPVGLAFLLALLFARVPLDASELPTRSTSRPNLATGTNLGQVLGVSSSSQTEYSRVIIELSEDARYKVSHLSNPERLYIDFSQTAISPRLASRKIDIKDELIERVRLGTDPGSVTRIVFDLHTAVRYRISKTSGPTRILVDLSRSVADTVEPQDRSSPYSTHENPPSANESAARAYAGRAPASFENVEAEKGGLNYAGAPPPQNVLALWVTTGGAYDDNVLGGDRQRTGDAYFNFGPSVDLRREGRRLSLVLNYQPNFRIYRQIAELNRIDQELVFDAAYRVSSRLALHAGATASYTNGFSQPSENGGILGGIGSPSSLNQTVFTPAIRQLRVSSRIDGTYHASARDSIGFSVGQSTLNFEQQMSNTGNLQNTVERDAGVLYRHRLSSHTSGGIDYLFQVIEFGGGTRTLVQSVLFSYEKQFSPSLSLSVFGGPQYAQLNERSSMSLGASTGQPSASITQWHWASGGVLTKRTDNIVFQLTARHEVANGGGLVGAVVDSSIAANVRHRLVGSWDAVWTAGYANNDSLVPAFPHEGYRNLTAGMGLQHPLTEKLNFGVRYNFVRQSVTGNSPLFGHFDRDLWSVQFTYRFREIALGR